MTDDEIVNLAETSDPLITETTIELGTRTRIICGAIGGLNILYSAVVLWQGKEGAATVAFVAFGALFTLLAVAGVIPKRLKAGTAELEMMRRQKERKAIERTTDNALATMTRDEMVQFIESNVREIAAGSEAAVVATNRAREAVLFEDSVIDKLRMSFEDIERNSNETRGYDALVRHDAQMVKVISALTVSVDSAIRYFRRSQTDSISTYWIVVHTFDIFDARTLSSKLQELLKDGPIGRLVISGAGITVMRMVADWLKDPENHGAPEDIVRTF